MTLSAAAVRRRSGEFGFEPPRGLGTRGRYVRVRPWADLLWVSGHTGRGPQGLVTAGTVPGGAPVELEAVFARRR